jgi:murein DD-endopeptidase MepM/ murein hydrolase activator NlpD
MRKSNVKVGQFIEQGDVIGWVGMTGIHLDLMYVIGSGKMVFKWILSNKNFLKLNQSTSH